MLKDRHTSPHRRFASEEKPNPEDRLKTTLTALGKGGYWQPPHNLAVNFALMGVNLYRFTILPDFWKQRGYREDLGGFVIHPNWAAVGNEVLGVKDGSGFATMTKGQVDLLLKKIPQMPSLEQSVKEELRLLETTFHIQISPAITAKLVKDALPTAKRRWKVDRLRIKDRLVPLDGSKPKDITYGM